MREVLSSVVSAHPAWSAFATVNLVLFLFMGIDKLLAKAQVRRMPERILFLCAFCFGAIGGILGMIAFSHKTRKLKFKIGFALLALLQVAAIYFILTTNWTTVV